MARHATSPVHHIGTFLLLAATILLLITTISAPVIKDIAILKVYLTNATTIRNSSVTFGTFGHCVLDVPPVQTDQDYCFPKSIGYDPANIMAQIDGPAYTQSTSSRDTSNALTRVMILHPILCFLAFLSFLLALGSGFLGSLLASLLAAFTFIVSVVVMALDFVWAGMIKNAVNGDGTGTTASYGVAMWTLLAAVVCLFLASLLVFFSCCSARRRERNVVKNDYGVNNGGVATTSRQRRFWNRGGARY